jgi:hypothetical protein
MQLLFPEGRRELRRARGRRHYQKHKERIKERNRERARARSSHDEKYNCDYCVHSKPIFVRYKEKHEQTRMHVTAVECADALMDHI